MSVLRRRAPSAGAPHRLDVGVARDLDRAAENDDQVRYVFALDMQDPDTVRITEVYGSKAGFEANSQAPWFADYMAEAGPLLAGQPEFHMALPHWIK